MGQKANCESNRVPAEQAGSRNWGSDQEPGKEMGLAEGLQRERLEGTGCQPAPSVWFPPHHLPSPSPLYPFLLD